MIVKKENVQIVIISAYAPTLEMSKKHPEKCDELESLIKTANRRDFLIVAWWFQREDRIWIQRPSKCYGEFRKRK